MRSVFSNLLINALHATDGGGRIKAALSAEGGSVIVSASDTGAGISAEHLPQVFEPNFPTKESGTGIGLAIVRKVIEEHSGIIRIECRQGQGTTFTVTLTAPEGYSCSW